MKVQVLVALLHVSISFASKKITTSTTSNAPTNAGKNLTPSSTKPRTEEPSGKSINNATDSTTQPNTSKPTSAISSTSQSTKTKQSPSTSTSETNKTSAKPAMPCENRNQSCSMCIKGDDCVYCSSDKSCYKKQKLIPTGCKSNKWYWGQCTIPGNVLIIVFPVVGGVLIIMLSCCVYCCCCKRCSRKKVTREESKSKQRRLDRENRSAQRKMNRSERHNAIRMKYGLLQNVNDDEDTIA
ncbi:pituitary tumor-transforming gene 1 protein-interacting protein-like [Xenia sp. Carnegie-2017]|uniref:pituitary tumor-transforming gene 1 protein-interacting protein-like n=1 Tax=Xenia sp. Carnegie-2017 TaxID=2897299 RepID=UPI001F049E06|nr:pituitary tumor-transforming gene 1 protein-interacting protein-like [Xenia sp. Carnegie-2017]